MPKAEKQETRSRWDNSIDITRWETYFWEIYQNEEHVETPLMEIQNREVPGYEGILNQLVKYDGESLEKQ